jgi:hypothetical protein
MISGTDGQRIPSIMMVARNPLLCPLNVWNVESELLLVKRNKMRVFAPLVGKRWWENE